MGEVGQGLVVEGSASLVEAVGVVADLEAERGRFGVGGGDDRGGDVLRGGGGVGGPHLLDCLGDIREDLGWSGVGQLVVDFGVVGAGLDDADVDSGWADLDGEGLAEGFEGGFGGRVDAAEGEADDSVGRGNHDDPPAVVGAHVGQDCLGQSEGPEEVGVECARGVGCCLRRRRRRRCRRC